MGRDISRQTTLESRPFHYDGDLMRCDRVDLSDLAREFGTPLYVYSAQQIKYRLSLFQTAFAARPHTICYAVKANSSLAILALLGRQGAGFDIVSGGELERIRIAHPAALERVVFSGVGKEAWEIDEALKANILLFNVESVSELELLSERAERMGVRARFALRVNPDVFADTHPYISPGLREHKFGVDISLAREIYKGAKSHSNLDAAGVSVHIGSQIRSVEPFAAALRRVAALVGELGEDGHEIRYVDVGGGLGIEYQAGEHFDPGVQVERYASSLAPVLGGLHQHLILEPGRFIVAQAGGLLTRVLNVKQNGNKTFVVTDAGMNDLIRPSLYQAHHEIVSVRRPSTAMEQTVDIVGPVCESGDFFARDRSMPALQVGDLALIMDAGAYGITLASNYNTRRRPAEVLVDGETAQLIRRRETYHDLFATEHLPVA